MDHSHSNKDSGQSLVEMVVVLVLLLVLAGGIVDLGRAFYSILILRDAVHEEYSCHKKPCVVHFRYG